MKWTALIFAGLCFLADGCCRLEAEEPAPLKAPEIILPTIDGDDVPAPLPVPPPKPSPQPRPVDTLAAGVWYVIQSDTPLQVKHYPPGLLDVLETRGPAKLLGRFADAPDTIDVREIESDWLYVLQARGTGKTMLVLTAIDGGQISIVEQWLTVSGQGPQPPPDPQPPTPIPISGKRVLIVYEAQQLSTMPYTQSVQISSGTLAEYLRTHTTSEAGKAGYRIWDQNVDRTNIGETWSKALDMPRTSLPWLIVTNGTTGYSGPLPVTEAETLTILRKHLGD